MGVQRPYVPQLKALICGYLEPEVQCCGSTLSIGHALLKIGVLYEKSRFSDLFFPPLLDNIVGKSSDFIGAFRHRVKAIFTHGGLLTIYYNF